MVDDTAIGDPFGFGNPKPPLLSNINLFLNNVSIHGFDWIDGLRNLSLSGQSDLHMPPVSNEVFKGLGSFPCSNIDPVQPLIVSSEFDFVKNVSLEAPSPPVVFPASVICSEESCHSPQDSLESGYFLRSCQKPVQGLGKNSSVVRKGRGRKTNLSKAQSRAKEDMLGGTQISIEKALRAEMALKKGRI